MSLRLSLLRISQGRPVICGTPLAHGDFALQIKLNDACQGLGLLLTEQIL